MHYALLIDTETINIEKRFIYDMGIVVLKYENRTYNVVSKHSFVIKQIYDNTMLFNTAYYGNKRPLYVSRLKGKTSQKKHYGHAMRFINKLIKQYKIKRVYAYNSSFDKSAFNFASNWFKRQEKILKLKWYDLMGMANNFIHNSQQYKDFCQANGFITKKQFYQTSAEKTYAFLTDNPTFIESHIGIEDCDIELTILNECMKQGYDFLHYKKKFLRA